MKDLVEASSAVVRQLQRHKDSVDDPSQNEFPSFPCGIALFHFLNGRRFLSKWAVVRVQGAENLVDGLQ
jgi:hypothetical protein